ncbi:MAG: winged helix-turn-helix transcriptional regulator [Rhodoferax sp.]|jgi:DNA-binding MarR family transcriptional regulator|nr:winged helix-turn-helix transcriptional regulator [Rhodoferax sp.]MBP9930579.1 winged helix-turn-helix transcriptional regulator [Rhodoferax sp.]HQZ05797.1 MarR family winged helix-turn-helix transcriptional regulator [Burkholderiaceae bacterium]
MPRSRTETGSAALHRSPDLDDLAQGLPESGAVDQVDTRFLQSLLGYNARRAALAIIERFLQRMAEFNLRPVEFSVMSVIHHNPGVTSRQLCAALNLLPPNLVGLIQSLESRGMVSRQPHPHDGRAVGLHPTPQGCALMLQAEQAAVELESPKSLGITTAQQKTLLQLLQKVYL